MSESKSCNCKGWHTCGIALSNNEQPTIQHAFLAGAKAGVDAAIAEGFAYTPMPFDRIAVAVSEAWTEYTPPEFD